MHAFSGASTTGYSSRVYLRLKDGYNQYHVSFLIGEARVSPTKPCTVPHMELTAAVMFVGLAIMMRRELGEEFSTFALLPEHVKYPIILPRKKHVTEMIVRHEHESRISRKEPCAC